MNSFIARHQAGLSYFFLAGFFGLLVAEGMGYVKQGTADRLTEGALLVLFFWFQRQRSPDPPPKDPP